VLFNRGSAERVVGFSEFQRFREGSSFFRWNVFLLPYVDASLWNFLDQRAAFRLHVGQLVVQEFECRCGKRNIGGCCITCCLLLCNFKNNVVVASQLYVVADVQFTVSRVDWVESRFNLSLVESRLSHRLKMLFNLCGNKVKRMWNPTFYYLVKPDEAK